MFPLFVWWIQTTAACYRPELFLLTQVQNMCTWCLLAVVFAVCLGATFWPRHSWHEATQHSTPTQLVLRCLFDVSGPQHHCRPKNWDFLYRKTLLVWSSLSDHLYLHGETKLLDAFLAVSGPRCWLIIITLKQITPDQEARLAFGWPVLHHLKEINDKVK